MRHTLRQTVLYGIVLATVLLVLWNQLTDRSAPFGVPFLAVLLCATWFSNLWVGTALAVLRWSLFIGPVLLVEQRLAAEAISRIFTIATQELLISLLLTLACDRIRRALLLERDTARHDVVTGVFNRKGFLERMRGEISRSQRFQRSFSLVYLDCDHFKEFNDRHGHDAGDEFLAQLGQLLRSQIRDFDAAARLGGDEFAVLLTEADQPAARSVVERLREQLQKEPAIAETGITFSFGVVTFDAPAPTCEVCLRQADQAMYAVKASGKNGVQYERFHGATREIP